MKKSIWRKFMTPSSQQFKGIHSKNCLCQFLPKFSFLWGKFTYCAMCFFNRNIALNCVLKNSLPKIIWKKACDGVKSKYLTSFIFDIPQNYYLELCKFARQLVFHESFQLEIYFWLVREKQCRVDQVKFVEDSL